VRKNCRLAAAAVRVQPWAGEWQVTQVRSLVPSFWKNGFV
jgi:hypothetical protein